jgi:hypothetical protein
MGLVKAPVWMMLQMMTSGRGQCRALLIDDDAPERQIQRPGALRTFARASFTQTVSPAAGRIRELKYSIDLKSPSSSPT